MFIKKAKIKDIEERLGRLEGEKETLEKKVELLGERTIKAEQDVAFFKTVIDGIKSNVEELTKMSDEQGADGENKPTINQIIDEWLNGKERV